MIRRCNPGVFGRRRRSAGACDQHCCRRRAALRSATNTAAERRLDRGLLPATESVVVERPEKDKAPAMGDMY
jgi:hypothetical protein